ncbi:guanylate kinase [Candidatus Magnetomoraceae bacterium gMMP-15]
MNNLYIVSAPSGAGKSTLCKAIMDRLPNLFYSISHTTRKPRTGEQHGIDYYFISKEKFEEAIKKGEWAEYARVHDNYYGTSVKMLNKGLALGHDILLDIDVQGARQILRSYPESITIFIMPPSMKVLKERLISRGTDDMQIISKRLINAEKELSEKNMYRHIIINNDLDTAISEMQAVFSNQPVS